MFKHSCPKKLIFIFVLIKYYFFDLTILLNILLYLLFKFNRRAHCKDDNTHLNVYYVNKQYIAIHFWSQ